MAWYDDLRKGARCFKCFGAVPKTIEEIKKCVKTKNGTLLSKYYKDKRTILHVKCGKCQKRFDSCRDKKPLPFDFFLPTLNTLIEFDGIQHNYKNSYYYSDTVVMHDNMKNKWAQKNNIKLVRIKSINKVEQTIDNLKE